MEFDPAQGSMDPPWWKIWKTELCCRCSVAKSCPTQWCHLTISSSVNPFSSCSPSFPAAGSFPMSQLHTSGGQSIGASASVHPTNIPGWFPLRLVGSPCSPRDSQESSPTLQFKSINSLALSLLYGPTLISLHDYWKNHSSDYTDLCPQSDVSAF